MALPPLDLKVGKLLATLALRPLTGDNPEDVALAHLLRYGALAEVVRYTLGCWAVAPEDPAARAPYERNLRRVWGAYVGALLAPTEAAWWLTHGHEGLGGAIAPATKIEAGKRASNG